jgi:hypothetical protein
MIYEGEKAYIQDVRFNVDGSIIAKVCMTELQNSSPNTGTRCVVQARMPPPDEATLRQAAKSISSFDESNYKEISPPSIVGKVRGSE